MGRVLTFDESRVLPFNYFRPTKTPGAYIFDFLVNFVSPRTWTTQTAFYLWNAVHGFFVKRKYDVPDISTKKVVKSTGPPLLFYFQNENPQRANLLMTIQESHMGMFGLVQQFRTPTSDPDHTYSENYERSLVECASRFTDCSTEPKCGRSSRVFSSTVTKRFAKRAES